MEVRIDSERLRRDIEELAGIGRDPRGGISRPSFSKADLAAREWLKTKILESGLSLRQDGAGNIFGRLEGNGPAVMSGSHIDTVLNGGAYDGSLGVLAALECLRRIREESIPHERPLEVAAFTDEEGNLVGDFLGSRAFMGLLDEEEVRKGATSFGVPLAKVLDGTGFTIEGILGAHASRPKLEAFVELHIEQGPVLEEEGISLGIVDSVAGKRYLQCFFAGEATHAATPIELRRDAFLGLADLSLKAAHLAAMAHEESAVTIGRVAVHPGVFSIVPGRADFSLDIRGFSANALENLEKEILDSGKDIAALRGLSFEARLVDATEPVRFSDKWLALAEEECRKLGHSCLRLRSGAGHDAQILSAACPTGMIFIPSPNGISHAPAETVKWDDVGKGADLLLRILIRLAAS